MVDVQTLFDKAQLRQGMHIADFGCGRAGHLVLPAAKMIGDKGVVYAVDILKSELADLDKRAKDMALLNVHPVWADLERPDSIAIPEDSLDAAYIMNVLVQSEKKMQILDQIKNLMKEKGRIVIIDWSKKGLKFGPQDEKFVDFEEIKKWAIENKFVVQEEFHAGEYHRGLVLFKAE